MTAGDRIDVVVIDDHDAIRTGIAAMLAGDPRLRVAGTVARLSELHGTGLPVDACVLDLAGIGDARQITDLMAEVPVVVCTAAEHWRHRVSAWTCGAKGVLGKNTGAVPLGDAVWDAVHRPDDVQPQLARALLDAIENCALRQPAYLVDLLDQVSRGRKVPRVLAAAGISDQTYATGIGGLRDALRAAGLGVLLIPDLSGSGGGAGGGGGPGNGAGDGGDHGGGGGTDRYEPGVIPAEAARITSRERDVLELYADGYTYDEIAPILQLSPFTVKVHLLNAMAKFGLPDRSADVRLIFATYLTGRHRRPELLRRRLDAVRTAPRPVRARRDRRRGDLDSGEQERPG